MRRLVKPLTTTKTEEKTKHKILLSAINVEKSNLEKLVDESKKQINLIETLKKETDLIKSELVSLCVEKDGLVKSNALLTIKNKELKHDNEVFVSSLNVLTNKKEAVATELLVLEKDFTDKNTKLDKTFTEKTNNQNVILSQLRNEVATLKEEISILTKTEQQISQDIANKNREKQSLDISIANRVKELAQINSDLAVIGSESDRATKQLKLVDGKVQELQEQLVAEDKKVQQKLEEISKLEKEILEKREELVAVLSQSRKLDEKVSAVRDLYDKAGLPINI